MNNKKYNWVFYLALILLFANFIYRLIDQSKLIKYFPLDYNNDGSSYMAQLFFMKVCGFHSYCSYWYNGFTAFLHSPPGWYFFTLPILEIFGKVNIANLSYVDYIGYILAKQRNVKFLTGDKEFENMDNVEFVK